ncbi:MAG: hypothetical protein KI786_00380 [Mameliella sp.]|nr:hypothetical protein [Phaeodactylibacter sp.]NRA50790.1 hypothetical protein [Phaeodactylibacter sp.]
MAKSILPLLNELFEEIPIHKIDHDMRALTLRVLDVDFEELTTKQRLKHLETAFSILELVSAIRDASQHEQRLDHLEQLITQAKNGCSVEAEMNQCLAEMRQILHRIKRNI